MTAIREDGPIVLGQKHRHNECDMAIFVYDDSSRTSFEWWCASRPNSLHIFRIMYVALNKTFRKAVHAVATSNNDGGTNGSAELDNRGMEHDSAGADSKKLGGMDGGTAAALYAQRELLEADAIAQDEFQLDPPFKLSNSRSKRIEQLWSALHV